MNLMIYTDGGARGNPGPAAIGVVVTDEGGTMLATYAKPIGLSTNNMAEYSAVVEALTMLKEPVFQKVEKITFVLDSTLVVNQLNGLFKIKNPDLRQKLLMIRNLENTRTTPIIYTHVLRQKNHIADGLVNQALDNDKEYFWIKQ